MSFQLLGQQVGNIDRRRAIETGVRDAGGTVVVRDGLDGKVGDAPQPEQLGANFRVRSSDQLLLRFEYLASALSSN